MKITNIRCFQISGPASYPATEERQVGKLDVYPEFAGRRHQGRATTELTQTYVQIDTDEGISGLFGDIFPETAPLILTKLKPHLVGKDPLASEYVWDVLYRQDRHAQSGYEMMAISAVDNALWDIKSKVLGVPIYRLLGGPTRARVECYASMLGHSLDLGLVRERAQWAVEQGFRAQKWFFRYGLPDGLEGMEKNIALVKTVREAVGPNVEIMLDAWMGWDATYAIRLLERVAEYHPRWMEEPVPPDHVGELAAIRKSSRVPIATGEHEYTRWGFLKLLQAEAVDVIQADPDWCGGISELVKICTLASAYGRHVIPHGHSIHAAVNVIASQPIATCPLAEYLILHKPTKQHFQQLVLRADRGHIALPTTPGLGLDLDEAKIERRVEIG